jgi:hypothetical protein
MEWRAKLQRQRFARAEGKSVILTLRKVALAATTAVCFLMLASAPALAQQAGEYLGFSADGEPLSIQVVDNPFFTYKLNLITVYYQVHCQTSGRTIHDGVLTQVGYFVNGNKSHFKLVDRSIHITANILFHGKDRMTGMIETRAPAFLEEGKRPRGADFCISPRQKFEAFISTPQQVAAFKAKSGRPQSAGSVR